MAKTVFAVGCHPDDIEFFMAGTLSLLKDAGYSIHYMSLANGSCGTTIYDAKTIVAMREAEARQSASVMGAVFHPPLTDDISVFFAEPLLARLAAIMREAAPEIVLTHSPVDYMEDHQNTSRLAVTAAFCRGMRNFPTIPPVPPVEQDVVVYHASPPGNRDPLRKLVRSGLYVDISGVMQKKRDMLSCHKSQKEWLDKSQGMDSYLLTMEKWARATGELSGKFEFAEGWRRHNSMGFSAQDTDPMFAALGSRAMVDIKYEKALMFPEQH